MDDDQRAGERWFRAVPWRRLYWNPITQGISLFAAAVGYQHNEYRWVWALGGYLFGLVGMTVAWAQERLLYGGEVYRCPRCNGTGRVTSNG